MIELYTIGFTNKSASSFFALLENSHVTKVVDTRINNVSQLAGFAKGRDLEFFLRRIGSISYEHSIEFAPTKELLGRYRKKNIDWNEYTLEYLNLLDMRKVSQSVNTEELHNSCLLCSEHSPEKCHRRLLAEYLQHVDPNIQIIHLR